MDPLHMLEELLLMLVDAGIICVELIGVVVILVAGIRGVIHYVQKDSHTQMVLFKGLSMGLGFFLGSEILRTVIVRTFAELALVGCIIVLRIALTFLMHWEMKVEKAEDEEKEKQQGESLSTPPEQK